MDEIKIINHIAAVQTYLNESQLNENEKRMVIKGLASFSDAYHQLKSEAYILAAAANNVGKS